MEGLSSPSGATHDNAQAEPAVPSLAERQRSRELQNQVPADWRPLTREDSGVPAIIGRYRRTRCRATR